MTAIKTPTESLRAALDAAEAMMAHNSTTVPNVAGMSPQALAAGALADIRVMQRLADALDVWQQHAAHRDQVSSPMGFRAYQVFGAWWVALMVASAHAEKGPRTMRWILSLVMSNKEIARLKRQAAEAAPPHAYEEA